MNISTAIELLENRAQVIFSLTKGVSQTQASHKPDPESWSILEVINHLYDEECEDFRVHLEMILFRPGEEWPTIDPQGWVTSRKYNERQFEPSVQNFLAERARSIRWLRSLETEGNVDLAVSVASPWGGRFHAGDMLSAWVGHDILHLRQLIELHWVLTLNEAAPYKLDYAGDW